MKMMLITALVAVQALAVSAQNHQYLLTWRATGYSVSGGKVVTTHLTEKDIIRTIAANNGISEKGLAFVYRADRRDTAVVRLSDGGIVSDWQQIQYTYTDVSAANGYTVKQAFLNDENHGQALGSLFGIENWRKNANGDTIGYSFRGSFNYSVPETDTVYTGTFSTGRRIVDTSEP